MQLEKKYVAWKEGEGWGGYIGGEREEEGMGEGKVSEGEYLVIRRAENR